MAGEVNVRTDVGMQIVNARSNEGDAMRFPLLEGKRWHIVDCAEGARRLLMYGVGEIDNLAHSAKG